MSEEPSGNPDMLAPMKDFRRILAPLSPPIGFGLLRLAAKARELSIPLSRIAVRISLMRLNGPLAFANASWAVLLRRLAELPKKSKEAMILAASSGWFFGWEASLQDLFQLIDRLGVVDADQVDKVMVNYYRENLISLTDDSARMYPAREAAIKVAVEAHSSSTLSGNGYTLSIPVFLAQAETIK